MNYYIIAAIVVLAIVLLFLTSKYYSSKSKGERGELEIRCVLEKLPKSEYTPVNNVVLHNGRDVTQIDHVVVSIYGIFVIETKNYQGYITGNEKSENWYRHYNKKKYAFHSPLRQNYSHVKALQELLKLDENKFIPIIVFSNFAKLNIESRSPVIYFKDMTQTIKQYNNRLFTESQVLELVDKIRRADIDSDEIMKQHNAVIKSREAETEKKVNEGICPKCGGMLVLRNGKYGKFLGCSNYPKCRYTMKK